MKKTKDSEDLKCVRNVTFKPNLEDARAKCRLRPRRGSAAQAEWAGEASEAQAPHAQAAHQEVSESLLRDNVQNVNATVDLKSQGVGLEEKLRKAVEALQEAKAEAKRLELIKEQLQMELIELRKELSELRKAEEEKAWLREKIARILGMKLVGQEVRRKEPADAPVV